MRFRWFRVTAVRVAMASLLGPMVQQVAAITVSDPEVRLAKLIGEHPEQKRTEFVYSSILNFIARYRVEEMARLNYADHVNPDGFGPNIIISMAGYELPVWYLDTKDANYIESLAAGYPTADSAFAALMASPGHKDHIMGDVKFFAEQTRYGIGYASSNRDPYRHFWVVITAPPAVNEDIRSFTEWEFEHLTLNQMQEGKSDLDGDGMGLLQEYIHDFDPLVAEVRPTMGIRFDPQTIRTLLTWPLRTEWDPTIEVMVEASELGGGLLQWKSVPYEVSQDGLDVGLPRGTGGAYRIRVVDVFDSFTSK